MPTIAEKAERFRELHARPGTFIIPNPFDAGSARILQHLGFEALATTSSGYAYSTGRMDYGITRDDAIAHAKILVDATDIPVSADLENGFGDDPDTVAETVRMAAGVGLAGCSIEDSTQRDADPILPEPGGLELTDGRFGVLAIGKHADDGAAGRVLLGRDVAGIVVSHVSPRESGSHRAGFDAGRSS